MMSSLTEALLLHDVGPVGENGVLRWRFTRDVQTVELAIHGDMPDYYLIEIRWPNGRRDVSRFSGLDSTVLNLRQLECQLHNSGFTFDGPSLEHREP
jgi:hypothetical protein